MAQLGRGRLVSGRGLLAGPLATEEAWHRQTHLKETPLRKFLRFSVGGEEYGLPIERLREILKARPATELPRVPAFILGVIAVRGVVVPVIDLRLRLHLAAAPPTPSSRIVIVARDEESFGLLVDEVRQVARLGDADIEATPAMLAGGEDFIAGIGRTGERLVVLLQLDALLDFDVPRVAGKERPSWR